MKFRVLFLIIPILLLCSVSLANNNYDGIAGAGAAYSGAAINRK